MNNQKPKGHCPNATEVSPWCGGLRFMNGILNHNQNLKPVVETSDKLAKIIWDYHHLNHFLRKMDCILVLGSHDIRVAEKAVDLFFEGYAPFIIFSGGLGNFTKGVFKKTEAEMFAEVAVQRGVPKAQIIIENRSTNTGENIEFTKKLLQEQGLNPQSFILVHKPFMGRRAYATFKRVWPEKDAIVTSPQIKYEEYPNNEIPKDFLLNVMVGDLQRIKVYPKKGFQVFQKIPSNVWKAYKKLVELGYTKHLLPYDAK